MRWDELEPGDILIHALTDCQGNDVKYLLLSKTPIVWLSTWDGNLLNKKCNFTREEIDQSVWKVIRLI